MGKSTDARNRKGKFGSGRGATYATAPRRGPPAVFVSCESGREKKCQREALELLHHYYYASRSRPSQSKVESGEEEAEKNAAQDSSSADANNKKSSGDDDNKPLSLEEELAMLRKGAMAEEVLTYEQGSKRQRTAGGGYTKKSSMKSPFSIYDTGMRGMVCILCNLPDSEMIPYDEILAEIKAAKENDEKEAATADDGGGGGGGGTKEGDASNEAPKANVSTSTTSEAAKDSSNEKKDTDKVLWDPVETVRCILRDGKSAAAKDDGESNKDEGSEDRKEDTSGENQLASASPPPGSRFILRIVPFQATVSSS